MQGNTWTDTSVGIGSIINHSATIDHDSNLGDFVCMSEFVPRRQCKCGSLTVLGIGSKGIVLLEMNVLLEEDL